MEIHSIRGISDENWSNLRMAAVRDGIATGELLNSILEEYDFGFTSKKVHKKTSKQRITRNSVESKPKKRKNPEEQFSMPTSGHRRNLKQEHYDGDLDDCWTDSNGSLHSAKN